MDALARLQKLGTVKAGQLSIISGASTNSTGATVIPGLVNISGVLTNNVFGSLYVRIYDESSVYNSVSLSAGNALPAAFSSRPVGAMQTTSISYANSVFNGYSSAYSVRLIGYIKPPTTNTYTFRATVQDGLVLYIGLDKILSSWIYQGSSIVLTGTSLLAGGVWLPIMMEHVTSSNNEKLLLEYSTDNVTFTTLAHGTSASSFQFMFDGTEVGPTQMGTSYVSGKTFASDIAYFSKGIALPGCGGFTGRTSELTNDYGYLTSLSTSISSLSVTTASLTQAYAGTLSVGTILNFSAGGSIGTNLVLSGSLSASSVIANTVNVSTLTAGTYLNVLFNATTSGTTSVGSLSVVGGGSFLGSLTGAALGLNVAVPAYTLDVVGSSRITGSVLTGSIMTANITAGNASLTNVYNSTLTVGTILNFSAGGSLGTNLTLSGTLVSPGASLTNVYNSTLTIGTILNYNPVGSTGTNLTLTGTLITPTASLTNAYNSTLSIGTILNYNPVGSLGTNLTLSGTLASYVASLTNAYNSTLSIGTILNYNPVGSIGSNLTLTGTLVSPGASLTNVYNSTLTIGTILNYNPVGSVGTNLTLTGTLITATASLTNTYNSTLSIGTILNFNPCGSLGTNLTLLGTLVSPVASLTNAYNSTLTVGTILNFTAGGSLGTNLTLSGTLSSPIASLTTVYNGTLTIGTILNFNPCGSVGTNITLSGTLVTPVGSISSLTGSSVSFNLGSISTLTGLSSSVTQGYAATLSIGTILNFLQGQTVSTSGTVSGSYLTGMIAFPSGGSFAGSLLTSGMGINNPNPTYAFDVNGAARINNVYFGSNSSSLMLLNQNQSGSVSTNFSLYQGVAGDTVLNSATGSPLQFKLGNVEYARLSSAGLFGINTSVPAYNLDVSGSARVTGTITAPSHIQTTPVYGLYNMAQITVNTSSSNWPYTLAQGNIPVNGSGQILAPFTGLYSFHINFWGSNPNFTELFFIFSGSQTQRPINYYAGGNTLNLVRFTTGGCVYLVAGDILTQAASTTTSTTLGPGVGPAFSLLLMQRTA